jgi:hypothetical protein
MADLRRQYSDQRRQSAEDQNRTVPFRLRLPLIRVSAELGRNRRRLPPTRPRLKHRYPPLLERGMGATQRVMGAKRALGTTRPAPRPSPSWEREGWVRVTGPCESGAVIRFATGWVILSPLFSVVDVAKSVTVPKSGTLGCTGAASQRRPVFGGRSGSRLERDPAMIQNRWWGGRSGFRSGPAHWLTTPREAAR